MDKEEALIKHAITGDEEAFKEIVDKYKNFVYSVCKSVIGNPHDSENATQETFIKIYRSLDQYEFKGFKTWVAKIALNKAIDYKRKLSKEKNITYLDEVSTDEISDSGAYAEEIIRKENKYKIRKLLEELPSIYKDIIYKYYMQHKSYQVISKEESISLKTVESRLYRGKKILKKMWEEVEHEAAL